MWPAGCHFYDRCPIHVAACAAAPIPLEALSGGPGHAARCIRADPRTASDRTNGLIA
jgi:ABC-type dipeptide/oligopeptide/nickel transport system ATPase component